MDLAGGGDAGDASALDAARDAVGIAHDAAMPDAPADATPPVDAALDVAADAGLDSAPADAAPLDSNPPDTGPDPCSQAVACSGLECGSVTTPCGPVQCGTCTSPNRCGEGGAPPNQCTHCTRQGACGAPYAPNYPVMYTCSASPDSGVAESLSGCFPVTGQPGTYCCP